MSKPRSSSETAPWSTALATAPGWGTSAMSRSPPSERIWKSSSKLPEASSVAS